MGYRFIKVEAGHHRLDVIISNPPVNILTGAVMGELIDALKTAADDKSIRAVVLRGEGKAWSAGADVSEHLPDKFEAMLDVFGELCELVRTYPIPTVAAVDGSCLGGGCEVAAMCDFIIASQRAKFGQPEIKVGVLPPAACAHFARKYGLGAALEIILTGDVFDAESSCELGLVTRIVPVDGFDAAVDEFVAKLTGSSGEVLRLTKRAALEGLERRSEEAAEKVDEIYRKELMTTRDAVEGLKAFLEKRQTEWKDE